METLREKLIRLVEKDLQAVRIILSNLEDQQKKLKLEEFSLLQTQVSLTKEVIDEKVDYGQDEVELIDKEIELLMEEVKTINDLYISKRKEIVEMHKQKEVIINRQAIAEL